ncbi:MAG: hypothetical protein H7Y07_13655 [Pyrinomonadaceae bacterium]|nr:hypothetical protein [Sphingobacteriaceae bacterium]
MHSQLKPQLSQQAFWDVDMNNIDYNKYARFIVEKIIERGTFQDFKELRNFYGDERIKKEVVNAKWLGDKEIYFCCEIFGLKPHDFKCYTKKQLNPKLWIY